MKQLQLFVESDLPCECANEKHLLTTYETKNCLDKIGRIKQLITDNGFQLSCNYFFLLEKVQGDCTAWNTENSRYLAMRSQFHNRIKEVTIPLHNPHFY